MANAFLEAEIDRLSAAVSSGFARCKVRKARACRKKLPTAEEASITLTYYVART